MRFAPVLVVAFLATSALTGCSSTPPPEQTTVHCMKCRRVVSSEAVVCTDCDAPRANPTVVVVEEPDNTAPPSNATPRTTPPAKQPAAAQPVANNGARRAATDADKRSIFLNNFAQADADAVEAELLGNADFVDVTPGGGAANRRVVIECKYVGANLKRDLVAVMRKLGFRFHFTEAKLPDQVELVRE